VENNAEEFGNIRAKFYQKTMTRNPPVDEIGERYRLNHAVVV